MSPGRAPVGRRFRASRLLPPQRLTLLGLYLLVAVVQLAQTPGRTTFDTKLDLLVDPGRFLAQSLTLWSPQVGMGEVQNQAYGYLFPLGPVFGLGHLLSSPAWLTERLWSTAVTIVAFEGARRLALAWGGLSWRGALLVGAAFVTAPRFLTTVGVLTGELLPTAVLPWVVLPLVLARRGRMRPYLACLLSGVAVLGMGGQNATETIAALPLPAIVLVHAVWRAELPWRCLLGWPSAVVAASAWWLGPLALLGRYSPPFLDYIESAANTTSVLGWVNSVRGAGHWVAYVFVGDAPWWQAGNALATTGWLVVVTALVAGLSLAGLVGRATPDRACLTFSVGLGLVCMVSAHGGAAGGLAADGLRSLLDGPLAPLRNVHKVDPLVRLPLALGFGYLAHDCRLALTSRLNRLPAWAGTSTTVGASVVCCCAVVVLGLSAQPAAAGDLRHAPGWSAIPAPWLRAAQAIDALPTGSRVLVVPASGFGLQVWGNPVDEPLQALTTGSWASRSQAPLVPGANTRLLDSIEKLLATGSGSSGLAPVLARSGFTDVLLRTDLDPDRSDAPDPSLVEDSLVTSPGLRRVQSFGVPPGALLPLQLWHVTGSLARDPRVSAVPARSAVVVQGGPESLISLLQNGIVAPNQPVLLAGQNAAGSLPVDVLTDTLQRREQAFGRVNDASSSLMTAQDPWRIDRAAHMYSAFPGEQESVAYYPGLASVSASSAAGYVDILGPVHPEQGPYSALDSDGTTSWVSAPYTNPVGQSLLVKLVAPVALGAVPIRLWNPLGEPAVTVVRLTTDAGSVTQPVAPRSRSVTVIAPPGVTRTVRITVVAVDAHRGADQVGIADVHLPGVDSSRTLVVPGAASPDTTMLFSSAAPVRACTYPHVSCDRDRAEPAEESAALDRSFAVVGHGDWRLSVGAVALPSPATSQLLAPVKAGYTVAGSSILGDDPVVAPAFAFDDNPATSWVTSPGDTTPTLTLAWPTDRTLTRIQVGLGSQNGVRLPTRVVLRSGQQVRTASVGAGGYGFFRPLRTHHLTLTFSAGGAAGSGVGEPMEISEVVIAGLGGIHYAPSPTSVTGQPCGFGPPVFVDGVRHATRVRGTLSEVLDGSPLSVQLCGSSTLALGPGPHRIRVASTAQFQPVQAELSPLTALVAKSAAGARGRQVRVDSWGASARSLSVAAGPASILWVTENDNPGWVATAAGHRLLPVVVDGWAQGWRLPAGSAITVDLSFTPQPTYAGSLITGGALALVLLGATAWLAVRRRRRDLGPEAVPARRRQLSAKTGQQAGLAMTVVAAALAGVGLLVGALLAAVPALRPQWRRRAVVVVLVVLSAGWQVLAGGDAVGADLVAALAVGLVVGPDFSHRDGPDVERSTQT